MHSKLHRVQSQESKYAIPVLDINAVQDTLSGGELSQPSIDNFGLMSVMCDIVEKLGDVPVWEISTIKFTVLHE